MIRLTVIRVDSSSVMAVVQRSTRTIAHALRVCFTAPYGALSGRGRRQGAGARMSHGHLAVRADATWPCTRTTLGCAHERHLRPATVFVTQNAKRPPDPKGPRGDGGEVRCC